MTFRVLPLDSVPQADWVPELVVDMPWQDFAGRYGVDFVAEDGTYEAPGPVAYAAIELGDGTICPLQHHYGKFGGRVLVYIRRGADREALAERVAADLDLPPERVTDSDRLR